MAAATKRGTTRNAATWAVAAVVGCALLALFWPRGDDAGPAPGGFLVDAGGRPQPLGPRLAPVTLLHFWATWCPPCIDEIPSLQQFSQSLHHEPDFEVVFVAVNDDPEQASRFIGDAAAGLLFDPNWEVAHRYGTRMLPETHIIVDGRRVHRFEGAQDWSEPRVQRQVHRWIQGGPQ